MDFSSIFWCQVVLAVKAASAATVIPATGMPAVVAETGVDNGTIELWLILPMCH